MVSDPADPDLLLLGMRVRIGTALDGSPVSVDTASMSVLVLVGDPARGKTTLARHLVRWWIADPLRTGRVFAEQPHQYADLPLEVHHLERAVSAAPAADARQMTVIDGADALRVPSVLALTNAPGPTIITSYGTAARGLDDTGHHPCLGLLTRELLREPTSRWSPVPGDAPGAAQGRLDWPGDVVPVVPDRRGEHDFPRHRWQALGREAG